MSCRRLARTWHVDISMEHRPARVLFFFFHVFHDNVMAVDFHLKSVQCVFFEYLDAMASIHAGRLQVD